MSKSLEKRSEPKNALDNWLQGYELPGFSAAVTQIVRIIRDDDSSNSDIAEGLAVDPRLSVRILRLVNSPGYGLRQSVDELVQAVQLIGRSSLESILIAATVRDTLPAQSQRGFDSKRFWRCSAQRAALAGGLARLVCPPERSLCWTAGLLQDLAIPLLVSQRPKVYCEVLRCWYAGEGSLCDLEQEALGFDHSELGGRISRHWDLPEKLCAAIVNHHDASLAPAPVAVVGLMPENHDAAAMAELVEAADTLCGVGAADCARLIEVAFEQADQLASLLC